ncbi:hypothetical protein CI238_12767 [Colletotrichum incanum]|uniref:Uncharacterized protein n=1 Tax=Colletotrichum incanum TaxID=1573173 RepID=A0A166LRW4_COLIC|nr:hypothetical protein CI238_12767 [Colletotrichum incanum]OHW89498.1 hypothetical protein CSPAE12_11926 [Colletotrichum incanum]
MAHRPLLLTETALQRLKDCTSENAMLADCWASDQVVIIACEPTSAYKTARVSVSPALQLDVLSPAANPVWPSLPSASHPTRNFCRRTIRQLERPKFNGGEMYRPQPWYSDTGVYHTYEMYDEDAGTKAQEVFNELAAGYTSICIASCHMKKTKAVLETFGVRLPETTVFVDVIKVLEHQAREREVPEELRTYTDKNVSIRKRKYDGRPGGNVTIDVYSMQNVQLLRVLGPVAEAHRLDLRKVERKNNVLKRIASRFRDGRKIVGR